MRLAFLPVALGLALFGFTAAGAQDRPKLIAEFKNWDAFTYREDGKPVCFISSSPLNSSPRNVRRGDVYILVTHRPDSKTLDEVSVYTGYPYEDASTATIDIDGRNFELFTNADTAWSYDADADKDLVRAMVRGSKMRIHGTSQRGTETVDSYSLLGFTAARNAINKACKIR
ncbi:MAG: hypothetical protein IID55_13485 [Proteobacteria bacterium]|nr:hypothetical protein [Pseudomonadota bacterium]